MLTALARASRDGARRARLVAALASVGGGRAAPEKQALGVRTLGLGARGPGDKRDAEARGNKDPPTAIESEGQLDNLDALAALLADASPQVDPKEPWLLKAPDATGKYPLLSSVQLETLGQSSYRVVMTVHDRKKKQVAVSGTHASPLDELCKAFAELALRGPDIAADKPAAELAARVAGLVPRGGSLIICSSSEASEPIYSLHLGGLARALAASDARLITLSARGFDHDKVTAAAQRTQYNKLNNVTAIRFFPLLAAAARRAAWCTTASTTSRAWPRRATRACWATAARKPCARRSASTA
jgi:hypothetical protein